VRVSHRFAAGSARFDEDNLVSYAGLVPLLGLVICGFIWIHLSRAAMILGAVWMTAGILYGAIRTRGFRADLVNFELPAEEDV